MYSLAEPPFFGQTMADINIQATLFNQLHQSSSFYVLKVSMEGKYTYVNKAFAEKFSFIAPSLIGMPFEVTLHPDDLPACQETSYACIANPDKIIPVRLRKPNADGSYFLSSYEFSAVRNGAGDVAEILCMGYDITETDKAYQEAKQSSDKFDLIIENITDAFYILDHNWKFIKVNRMFEQLTGVSRERLLSMTIWELYPSPEGVQNLRNIYTKVLEDNISLRMEEYIPTFDKWLERTIYPSQEGLTVLFKDITDRKKAEDNIREANNKLIAALNSTSDLNILISPSHTVLSFNKVAAEFTRTFLERTLAEGDSFWAHIIPGTEALFSHNIQLALQGQSVGLKHKLKFAPGVEIWYRLRFYPVYDSDQQLIGVTFNATNIDKEQRQLENLEEIATLYSNQIRRPVATIMGITRLINEDDLKTNNKEWFGYLIKTTHELDRVVNRIMKKSNEIE